MALIAELVVADPPEAWRDLGFTVDGDRCQVGSVVHVLRGGAGQGVVSWALDGVAVEADELEGLPSAAGQATENRPPEHPNGVTSLDHLVVFTPDLQRTVNTLELAGLECRRLRPAGRGNVQAFFRLGEVILEVVGPETAAGDGPARFFGLAFTVTDLDATAAFLGDRLHSPKDAVQAGRRIATLDKHAGSTVAMAFMSPEARRPGANQ